MGDNSSNWSRQFMWEPFHADISFNDEKLNIKTKKVILCGISTTGDVRINDYGAELDIALSARDLELQPTALCLTDKHIDITGTLEIKAALKAKGNIDTISKSFHGVLDISAKDGKIVKSRTTDKTLNLVNETENFKGKLPDLEKKIIDYRFLTMRGTIEEHRVVLEEGMLDAYIFEILAQGQLDLQKKTLDLIALVAPLNIGQRIFSKIPMLGHILGVNLVSIPVKIKGNIYDPQVTFLILAAIQEKLADLKAGRIPLEEMVVAQTLSRELNEYSYFSHAATAAKQLETLGKTLRMGQRVRYVHIAAGPSARAWDLADDLDPRAVDMPRYRELLLRAMHEVMQPLGVSEATLRAWLFSRAGYVAPPGSIRSSKDLDQIHLPLFASNTARACLPYDEPQQAIRRPIHP